MAMIKCPECGRELSTYAPACPGCGVPQEIINRLLTERKADIKAENELEDDCDKTRLVYPRTQKKSKKIDKIQKKARIKEESVKCIVCKTTYVTDGGKKCPACEFPVFTLGKNKGTIKQEIKKYREQTGISFLELSMGQTIKMGKYGGEDIRWQVLAVEDDKALLISQKGVATKRYNEKPKAVTWETCTLRRWLNREFYNSAFTEEERKRIRISHNVAETNPKYNSKTGKSTAKSTHDSVFLLSIQEVEKYFRNDEERQVKPTRYAKANGAYEDNSTKCCCWWLRSPGHNSNGAAGVDSEGLVLCDGYYVNFVDICVRPAIWVNL